MQGISAVTFKGKFIMSDKFKGRTAEFVHDIVKKEKDGMTNADILSNLPFDVEICRRNKSHKAIHPIVDMYIDYKQFWGKQSYYVEHGADYAIQKIRTWLDNFEKFIKTNENKTKLTPKEELDKTFDFIYNYGGVKRYKPLQRHELQ